MEELRSKGKENTRLIYARHGMPYDRTFGVSNADLKLIAKTIKGQQELACQLYDTGNVDAMYLAGIVADGAKMTPQQLESWAEGAAGIPMILEHTVPWVTVDNPKARALSIQWIQSEKEHIQTAGWRSYCGIIATAPDSNLDLSEIQKLLNIAENEINHATDRVKLAMNAFVVSVGCYVLPLASAAKETAKRIDKIMVDVGDTACKVPYAIAAIEKVESANKLGQKRKTIRC